MLSHSFDQFYIVIKFELPKTEDLRLATFKFDLILTNVAMLIIPVPILIMQNF